MACLQIQAQTMYNQGDLSLTFFYFGMHDSTNCSSFANESCNFTKNNSFVNDSIVIKDANFGGIQAWAVNTTGTNPWSGSLFANTILPIIGDEDVVNGNAFFQPLSTFKAISGLDTIYNIINGFMLPVPDACIYGNVAGKIYIDYNSDCIYNSGDAPLNFVPAEINNNLSSGGSIQKYAYSSPTGNYTAKIQESWMTNFVVKIPTNYQFIFPSTACSPAQYTGTTLPQSNYDFSLQCTSNLDVQSRPYGPPTVRPAIPFMLHPFVSNTGCNAASGVLTLVKDVKTTYNAALSSNPPSYVNGDTLQWNYSNISNLSSGAFWNSFFAGVHLTPTLAANIGDTLCFQTFTTPMAGDVNAANNNASICIPVVNSYDPNIKEVSPKGSGLAGNIPPTTSQLDYTIHFQNTGNAVAFNVYVLDTLDGDIDPKSLRIIGASHTMSPEWVTPNVLKFRFNNINLPDSISNEPKSHGQFSYTVKLKSGLPLGTQIRNTAHIYFDTNPAIVTNTTINTLALPESISDIKNNLAVQIYPNPVTDILHINVLEPNADNVEIVLLNSNGTLVQLIKNAGSTTSIDMRNVANGLYFVRITNSQGSAMYKVRK